MTLTRPIMINLALDPYTFCGDVYKRGRWGLRRRYLGGGRGAMRIDDALGPHSNSKKINGARYVAGQIGPF